MKKGKRGRSKVRTFFTVFAVFFLLVLILIAFINLSLPKASPLLEQLSQTERIRLAEVRNLQGELGDQIWPGWGKQNTPILVYNEQTAFLTGMPEDPAKGWIRVPYRSVEGTHWEKVNGSYPYYRQKLPDDGATPQAFIVQVGELFAASMTTKDWTRIHLMQLIKNDLPNILRPIMPYSLIINRFDSDWHITAILHESFHAFQASMAYERVKKAENMNTYHDSYPWDDIDIREAWLQERQLLGKAMITEDVEEVEGLIRQWLLVREERRVWMDPVYIRYEKEREWLEGSAKYAEMNSWKYASQDTLYTPLAAMENDPDFSFYRDAEAQWEKELRQLQSDLNFSESMMYYTGWAQAELLDKIYPDWKSFAFEDGIYLDDLLAKICVPQSCPELTAE